MNITATLLAQILTFVILVWFVKATLWGPMTRMLEDRKARIAEGLDAADRGQRELEQANDQVEKILRESREQAEQILDQARRRSNQMIEEARDNARLEGERMIEHARGEIDQQLNRVKEELRAQLAALALEGAERILESSVDEQKHRKMLDELATEL